MIKFIIGILALFLYSGFLVDYSKHAITKKITYRCWSMHDEMTMEERTKFCREMIEGYKDHYEDPKYHG